MVSRPELVWPERPATATLVNAGSRHEAPGEGRGLARPGSPGADPAAGSRSGWPGDLTPVRWRSWSLPDTQQHRSPLRLWWGRGNACAWARGVCGSVGGAPVGARGGAPVGVRQHRATPACRQRLHLPALQSLATWESENKIRCTQTLLEGDGPKTYWTRELANDELILTFGADDVVCTRIYVRE
ncbi:PREDICTED: cellular retinoic acid-binding protein 1 [Condylura cristata]|uniref:cellular retinoic acid-binding protein 1 n=1 Tax=Condylura cristata TaxID=143302 RepID=UPI000642C8DB|nr:PREDICTED: cellular retinoic acid-binding protein 1 [Condylura cristata]